MANPVELERKFEELQTRLALIASARARMVLIHEFVSGFKKEPTL